MTSPILCTRCGAPLPAHASSVVVTCAFCGTSAAPAPKVVERVVERVVVVQPLAPEGGAGLACPRCARAMRRVEAGSERVDVCERCGGALLTSAQVSALNEARNDALTQAIRYVSPIAMPIPPRTKTLSCPACSEALRIREVEGSVLLMHVCETHGAFFERGAVEAYMEAQVAARAGELDDDALSSAGIRKKGLFSFLRR